jgi:hypothetical protein
MKTKLSKNKIEALGKVTGKVYSFYAIEESQVITEEQMEKIKKHATIIRRKLNNEKSI